MKISHSRHSKVKFYSDCKFHHENNTNNFIILSIAKRIFQLSIGKYKNLFIENYM